MFQGRRQFLKSILVCIAFLSVASTLAAQAARIESRCGRPVTSSTVSVWQSNGLSIDAIEISGNATRVFPEISGIPLREGTNNNFDVIPLQSGDGIAFLDNYGIEEDKVLTVVTATGRILTAESSNSLFQWRRLIPEIEPGRFGLVAQEISSSNAAILTITLNENELVWGQPEILPFPLYRSRTNFSVYVSPDGNYIHYLGRDEVTDVPVYFIYSIIGNNYIWKSEARNIDGHPDILWFEDDAERVAIVSGTTPETMSQLFTIYRTGTVEFYADLTRGYGEGAAILNAFEGVIHAPATAFWIVSDGLRETSSGLRLAGIDAITGNLIDYCVNGTSGLLLETPDGEQVIIEKVDSSQTEGYVGVDLGTGNTTSLSLSSSGKILAVGDMPPF